jgi:hypothetical protein
MHAMDEIARLKEKIYDFYQASEACGTYISSTNGLFPAYYTSLLLLQDSTESLMHHRSRGFPQQDPLQAYLELWGVLQAVIIQQDAILELSKVFFGEAPSTAALPGWKKIRTFRNECAGHPANQSRRNGPTVRTVISRSFGDYSRMWYEKAESETVTFPKVNLGQMIDDYVLEAESLLASVLAEMHRRWP